MLEGMWSMGNTPLLPVAVQTCGTMLEISISVSQKTVNQPTSRTRNITLCHVPKDVKDICSTMFIPALFVIARTWKHRCPSTEE